MLLSKTYETWSQDDLEHGDSDSISYCGDLDYISGDKQVLTLHFNGTDRQKKYWIKALKIHLEIKD